jgi:hypothetical protein
LKKNEGDIEGKDKKKPAEILAGFLSKEINGLSQVNRANSGSEIKFAFQKTVN